MFLDQYFSVENVFWKKSFTEALISNCCNPKKIGKCCKDGSRKLLLSIDLLSGIVKHSSQGLVTVTYYCTKHNHHFLNQNYVLNKSFCDPAKKFLNLKLRH